MTRTQLEDNHNEGTWLCFLSHCCKVKYICYKIKIFWPLSTLYYLTVQPSLLRQKQNLWRKDFFIFKDLNNLVFVVNTRFRYCPHFQGCNPLPSSPPAQQALPSSSSPPCNLVLVAKQDVKHLFQISCFADYMATSTLAYSSICN